MADPDGKAWIAEFRDATHTQLGLWWMRDRRDGLTEATDDLRASRSGGEASQEWNGRAGERVGGPGEEEDRYETGLHLRKPPNVWRQWRAQRVHCTPGLGFGLLSGELLRDDVGFASDEDLVGRGEVLPRGAAPPDGATDGDDAGR